VRALADELSAMREHGGPGSGDAISALAALLAPEGRLAKQCGFSYELRLHRARGYGALKAILEILAEDEGLTLTEISQRLQRTPGSTKDYLSWLEDVDLVTSRQKRYSFSDPLLRVWVRLHCRPSAPTEDDLAREVHRYALPRLPPSSEAPPPAPHAEPAFAMAGGSSSGIIEID
jgi:Winged helix-turn-helix DNA-binding